MSNAALRLLMRGGAEPVNAIPVRAKSVRVGSGGSVTVTFDEGTALDSTHLLLCFVFWSGSVSTFTGWTDVTLTDISVGGFKVLARQGDGSTNSITITGTNNVKSVYILGFEGFTSVTPLEKKIAAVSGASPTAMPSLPSTPEGSGVVVVCAQDSNSAVLWTGWSNGFTMAATPATNSLIAVSYKAYTGPSGSYSTAVSATNGPPDNGSILLFPLV